MINFVMVEDNSKHLARVEKLIISNMMSNKLEFNIKKFRDYNEELLNFIENKMNDCIYILDLELPSGDGIDIARKIRYEQNDWSSPIIIFTAHSSLALDAFKMRLQILDYVNKQFDSEKNLNELFDICINMICKDYSYRYTYNNVEYVIPYNKILYVFRDGRKTRIVTDEEDYFQNISISDIKGVLPSFFVISCKGILINMKRVKNIDWTNLKVTFDNNRSEYIVSIKRKKEIESYGH